MKKNTWEPRWSRRVPKVEAIGHAHSELKIELCTKKTRGRNTWVLLGITRLLPCFTGFYWVLLSYQGLQWFSLGCTGFYWVWVGFNFLPTNSQSRFDRNPLKKLRTALNATSGCDRTRPPRVKEQSRMPKKKRKQRKPPRSSRGTTKVAAIDPSRTEKRSKGHLDTPTQRSEQQPNTQTIFKFTTVIHSQTSYYPV